MNDIIPDGELAKKEAALIEMKAIATKLKKEKTALLAAVHTIINSIKDQ